MVILVALFLVVAVILMLVLLEKSTGGKDGGIGCVSGVVILALLALAASQYEPSNGPRLAGEFRQLIGVGLGVLAVIGIGYLAFVYIALCIENAPFRRATREAKARYQEQLDIQWAAGVIPSTPDPREVSEKREVRASYWVDALSLLDDDVFDVWLENHGAEIRSTLTPEDWQAINRRREARRLNR